MTDKLQSRFRFEAFLTAVLMLPAACSSRANDSLHDDGEGSVADSAVGGPADARSDIEPMATPDAAPSSEPPIDRDSSTAPDDAAGERDAKIREASGGKDSSAAPDSTTSADAARVVDAGPGTDSGSKSGCPIELMGWAAVAADGVTTTTGGGNASPTTVTTFAALKAAVQDTAPRVVIVAGTINTEGGFALDIASNKTVIGADKNATIYGGINMSNVSNVIIRNLNIHGVWPNSGPDDTVASHTSHHIWYDHMNIWDAGDGELDITNESNYQTVSYSKFWYTNPAHPHRLASLNGSGGGDHPEDLGKLKVTYHHNWWAELVNERMPRVVYGQGHQFNNYFTSTGNLYCIGVGSYGAILVENNYFKNVNNPHQFMYALPMSITASGNIYDNTTGVKDTGAGGTGTAVAPFTTPPYSYRMDKAADVPSIVTRCAGPQ